MNDLQSATSHPRTPNTPAAVLAVTFALGVAAISGCDREQPSFKEVEAYPQELRSLSRSLVFTERQGINQDVTIRTEDAEQQLTLDMAREQVTWQSAQRDRRVTDTFRQGSSSASATESFESLEKSPVDILFVVDSSSSMRQEQQQLATKLSAVVGHISSADWRLAVVSTDDNDPCTDRRVITKDHRDPSAAFKAAIDAIGLDGAGTEKGIYKAVDGLEACRGEGWLRAHSAVATVIVSDEDNCSDGTECRGEAYGKPAYLTDYLDSIRTLGTTAKVYGIIKKSRRECSSAPHVGRQYLKAIKDSGGIAGSICADDYSDVLSALSKDLSQTLIHNLNLAHEPIGRDAVTVTVDGTVLSGGQYRLAGQTIVLSEPLSAGQKATVAYTYRPEPLKLRFALSQKPKGRKVAVVVDDVAHHDFKVVREGGNSYLSFPAPPAANAKIVAKYHNGTQLKTTFTFAEPMGKATDLAVFIGGERTDAYKVQTRSWQTRITFAEAPADAARIRVTFARELGRKLRYALPVTAGELQQVTDASTGAEVEGWLEDDGRTLVINPDEFAVGRRIALAFRLIEGVAVELPEDIDAATLTISRAGQTVCADAIDIVGRTLDLMRCRAAIGDGPVQVSFVRVVDGRDYLVPWPNIEAAEQGSLQQVTVTVNEQAYTDFSVEADGIRFHTPLLDKDRIYIRCDYRDIL